MISVIDIWISLPSWQRNMGEQCASCTLLVNQEKAKSAATRFSFALFFFVLFSFALLCFALLPPSLTPSALLRVTLCCVWRANRTSAMWWNRTSIQRAPDETPTRRSSNFRKKVFFILLPKYEFLESSKQRRYAPVSFRFKMKLYMNSGWRDFHIQTQATEV